MSFYSRLSCQMDDVSNLHVPSPTLLSLSLLLRLCLDTEQPLPLAPLKTSQTRRHLPASGSTHATRKIGPPHCGREGGGGAVLILDPVAGRPEGPGSPSALGARAAGQSSKILPFQHRIRDLFGNCVFLFKGGPSYHKSYPTDNKGLGFCQGAASRFSLHVAHSL